MTKIPKELTKVTTFSKVFAGILFIFLPIIAFLTGMIYQKNLDQQIMMLEKENEARSTLLMPKKITNKAVDMTNWTTFSNKQYQFEFKHPNLTACCTIAGPVSGTPRKITTLADQATVQANSDKPFEGFAVFVEPNTAKKDFQQYVEDQKKSLEANAQKVESQNNTPKKDSTIKVGEKEGVMLEGYAWWADMVYVPMDNGSILVIAKNKTEDESFDQTFIQILNSFTFTDENMNPMERGATNSAQ